MREGITLVTGATGAQGGSVARELLAKGERVRALTRKPSTPAADALAELGAEVVGGDLSDVAGLMTAMRGCDRVFGVTNFWEHFGTETVHGKNLVDAAREARVDHIILSTLPSSLELSGGAIRVPHFESKAEIERYARDAGLSATSVHVAFYFENFISYFPPRPGADGTLQIGFPQGDTPLAGVAAEDLGVVVDAIFRDRARFLGKTVGVVSEDLRGEQYAAGLGEALGREVRYEPIARDVYAGLGFDGADELAAMFDLNRRFILSRAQDIVLTRELSPGVQGFQSWAMKHRAALRAAVDPR